MSIITFFYKHKFIFFLVCSFLLYGNTLKNSYALDDSYVTTKRSITSKGLSSFKEIFTTHYIVEEGGVNTFEYRPLVKLCFAVEHEFFGVNPAISHFFNVVLYALCLYLLFLICSRLFSSYPPFFSELIVLFFAFIPMHCEVVASLKNRDILLSFIFACLCFIQLIKFSETKKYINLILGWLFLSLSFMAKLDPLPFIVLFPLLLFLQKSTTLKQSLLITFTLVMSYYTFDTLMNILVDQTQTKRPLEYYENPLYFSESLSLKLSTALNSFGFYIKMFIIPNDMAAYYGYNTLDVFNFFTINSLLALLFILASVILMILYKKEKKNPLISGLLIFYISISMYLNIVKTVPGIVADRFSYIPSIGISIVIIFLLFKYCNKKIFASKTGELRLNFKILFLLILCSNFILVYSRNSNWKNSLELYTNDIKSQPNSLKLHNLCGNEIIAEVIKPNGIIPKHKKKEYLVIAEASLKKVLVLDSNNIKALNNLSFIYLNFYRDYKTAKSYISKAYSIDSSKHEVVYNLALCNYNLNNLPEAKKFTKLAFNLKPEDELTLELMTELYSNEAIIDEGIALIENKLKDHPESFKLNLLIGNLWIAKKDTINALKFLRRASDQKPKDVQLGEIIDILSK